MPIFSQRPSFIGSRISSFPRRIRIPLSGSPIIDGWSRITGAGAGSQGLVQGLSTLRRGVDTPSFPVVAPNPINVPHALVAWVGGDDDEGTKISIQQQLGTISGAGALGVKSLETVAGATKVEPIGKAAGKKAGTVGVGKIAKTISGAVSGKGVGVIGVGKKGIIHSGKKIVPKKSIKKIHHAGKITHPGKGIHPIHPKVKGGIAKGAIIGGGAIVGGGAVVGGGAKVVGGGAIVGGAGAAVVGKSVVQQSVSVAKVGDVSGDKITDGFDKLVDGKAAVGNAKINLKVNDADNVKINIGTDTGKVIKDAPAVKGDKSGDIVIKGKISTVVEPVATKIVAAKTVETIAAKAGAATAGAVVGKVSGAVKENIILANKDIIVPGPKIIVPDQKILPGKPILEKVIPVKKDLVPHKAVISHKAPIVKL